MIIFFITAIAFGQEEDRKIRYQKETEIDFDDLEITGELVKPTGALIVERSGVKFNPLIELRTDWNLEMSRSVNSIK